QRADELAVIPQRSFAASGKTVPEVFTDDAIVGDECTRVVELVAGADQKDRRSRRLFVIDVDFLAVPPRRLRNGIRVGAAADGVGYFVAESASDFVEPGRSALIFNSVMEERGDCFIFVSAVFED